MFGLQDTDKLADDVVVALTLYGEAEGEGYEGQQAVANVIMTRTALDSGRD